MQEGHKSIHELAPTHTDPHCAPKWKGLLMNTVANSTAGSSETAPEYDHHKMHGQGLADEAYKQAKAKRAGHAVPIEVQHRDRATSAVKASIHQISPA